MRVLSLEEPYAVAQIPDLGAGTVDIARKGFLIILQFADKLPEEGRLAIVVVEEFEGGMFFPLLPFDLLFELIYFLPQFLEVGAFLLQLAALRQGRGGKQSESQEQGDRDRACSHQRWMISVRSGMVREQSTGLLTSTPE